MSKQGMTNAEIQRVRDVIGRVVNALSDRKIPVYQRGTNAYVRYDPKTSEPLFVNLPSIPDNADEQLIVAVQGFLDHEVAHLLFTDFTAGVRHMPEVSKSKTLYALSQILEDVRIERAMQKKFSGSSMNLGRVRDFVIDRVLRPDVEKAVDEGADQAKLMSMLLPAALRALDGQKEMAKFMEDGNWDHFGVHAETLRKFVPQIKALSSTEDVYKLAKKIEQTISRRTPPPPPSGDKGEKDQKNKPQKKDKKEQRGEEEEPQDSDCSGDGEGQGESRDDAGDGDSKSGKDEAKPEEGDDKDEGEQDKPEESKPDPKGDEEGEKSDDPESEKDDPEPEPEESDGDDAQGDEDEPTDDAEDGADQDDAGTSAGESGDENGEDNESSGEVSDNDDPGKTSTPTQPHELEDFSQEREGGADYGGEHDWPDLDPMEIKDLDEMACRALSERVAQLLQEPDEHPYFPYTKDFDHIGPLPSLGLPASRMPSLADLGSYQLAEKNGHVIQSEIQRIFRARSAARWQPGLRKGKINPHSLHRLHTGDDRVFRQRQEAQSRSVAVSLVIDMSGSMSGRKVFGACTAATMFTNILDKLGLPNEVTAFTTMSEFVADKVGISDALVLMQKDYREQRSADMERYYEEQRVWQSKGRIGDPPQYPGSQYARIDPICLFTLKEFRERLTDDHRRQINMIPEFYSGRISAGNVDGESVAYAGHRLMQRKETRKIMIVMSDGSPASDGDSGQLCRHLRKTVQELTDAGVEMLGLGMMDNSVRSYYPKSVVVNAADKIPGAILELLQLLLN